MMRMYCIKACYTYQCMERNVYYIEYRIRSLSCISTQRYDIRRVYAEIS